MRKIFRSLFILLPVVLFAQGQNNRSFTHTVQLQEKPEAVWNAITDFSTFSLWDSNVVDLRCPSELEEGSMCKVIVRTGQVFDVEILELKEGESYTVRYKLKNGNVYIKRALTSSGSLELTESVWYTGLSKRTFEGFKGSDYDTTLKTRLQDFKKYLEEDLAEGQ